MRNMLVLMVILVLMVVSMEGIQEKKCSQDPLSGKTLIETDADFISVLSLLESTQRLRIRTKLFYNSKPTGESIPTLSFTSKSIIFSVEVLDGNASTLSIVFQVVYDPSIVPQRGNHLSELRLLNIQ